MDIEAAGRVFTEPAAYADDEWFHRACALLRRESPVHFVAADGYNPFWAITKHHDVMEIERHPDIWLNAPRPALVAKRNDEQRAGLPIRSLVQMDAPDHPIYRQITVDWFKPNSIGRLDDRISALAKRSVDRMTELGGECDFVTDIAVHYRLQVILSILGLPEDDYPRMLRLTQELFGNVDPELARTRDQDAVRAILLDFVDYFRALTHRRRTEPTDDLASVIANAHVDGHLIGDLEAIGYYVIIATAGHDTTSASIAGGLHALLQHPDQLELLQARPALVNTALEEIIRWVSPVKQFMRTAATD